jgi:hypothetical protein
MRFQARVRKEIPQANSPNGLNYTAVVRLFWTGAPRRHSSSGSPAPGPYAGSPSGTVLHTPRERAYTSAELRGDMRREESRGGHHANTHPTTSQQTR